MIPIPGNVESSPANGRGGDKVYVRYDENYGGFLGFLWNDRRIPSSWYSTLENLPTWARKRVERKGSFCNEPGCTNARARGTRCRKHARKPAGQKG